MTNQTISDAQIRAAFIARSEGSPSHDLAERIGAQARKVRQQPRLVVLPGGLGIQPERLLWAAAISATSLALVGGLLLAGRQPDDQAVVPPIETPSATPSTSLSAPPPSVSPSESPAPPASPEPTPPQEPSAPPTVAVDPRLVVDAPAVTVAGDVRVRSKPTVDASSAKLEPLLPVGIRLLVIEAPVTADGYAWYHVIPLDAGYPKGWVAAGSRDGDPWIAFDQIDCPELPVAARNLMSAEVYAGLRCFGNRDIEVTGDASCYAADVDATITGPSWLSTDYVCSFLLDGSQMPFYLDGINLELPVDQHVQVTGHFGDPQSSTCVWAVDPPAPDPSEVTASCRAMFVATDWKALPID